MFKCPDCPYRTLCKNYLVDHKRLMHNQTGSGQYICVVGKCFEKPMLYPNQAKLDKHRTCHENKSCTTCGKVFGAKRNLRRHEKIKHEQNQMNISTIQTQVMETTMVMLQSYSWINTNMLSLMKNVLKFVLKYILSQ